MRVVLSLLVATVLIACGDDNGSGGDGASGDRPAVVVTATIVGDIVERVAGDAADVEVLFPIGADPHEFAPSVRQAEAMGDADLLVISGAGFEAGLDDAIEVAGDGGTEVFAFADHVELIGDDPHYWTDPTRVAAGVDDLADALVAAGAGEEVRQRASDYAAELEAVDAELDTLLASIPAARRVLVTNHEVLGYFAARYGFEVVGAVIPSLTTGAEPSAADIEDLAALIDAHGVPAIFGETSSPSALAETLADTTGGDVEVVELFTESLGEPGSGAETYLDLLRTDARLIHEALS